MKTGFIGLGAMGFHMAHNLARAGLLHGAWNRSPAKVGALAAEAGVHTYESPEALAADVDAVVMCVSADEDVLDLVDRIGPSLRPGAIVVDCSTVSAETAREAARRLAGTGAEFLDCPVSGGVEGAKNRDARDHVRR